MSRKKGINGLGHYSALVILDILNVVIKNQERGIEDCGVLCYKDSRQSQASKEYFSLELEKHKLAAEEIKRFRAEISTRVWLAYQEEKASIRSDKA